MLFIVVISYTPVRSLHGKSEAEVPGFASTNGELFRESRPKGTGFCMMRWELTVEKSVAVMEAATRLKVLSVMFADAVGCVTAMVSWGI